MLEFHVPMRWADLDSLNHVNNVVYVDYAMEARGRLVDDGVLDVALPIRRLRVDFLRPLLLSSKPVLVRSTIDGDVLTHEIRSTDGSAHFCTITTEHGHPVRTEDDRGTQAGIRLRRTDIGPDGVVTVVKLFELFQETRIYAFSRIIPHRIAGRFVVGRVELEFGEPITWRSDPYPVTSYIAHVSRSSFSSITRIDDGRYGTATATLVGFDQETQSSRRLDDDEREALTAALLPDE